mgnify:CR=1 FL=1
MAKKSEIFKSESKRIISIGEEETGSEIFMSIKFCLIDTLTNLNGVQYSKAFLQEIADNPDKYLSLPLMAEFNKLSQGKTDNLTHAFDPNTQTFSSQMIGSFISFQVQQNTENATITELIGEARIPKRFTDICEVLLELFNSGNLTLSYEIAVGSYTMSSGIKYVDASEFNYLFGMAVVTNPAVLSAHSLTLVAQIMDGSQGEKIIATKNNKVSEEENYMTIEQMEVQVANLRVEIATKDAAIKEKDTILKQNAADIKEKDAKMCAKEEDVKAKEKELETTKDELKNKDTEVESKKEDVKVKTAEIAKANDKLAILSASVIEKDKLIAELEPIKKAYEVAEAAKVEQKLVADRVALKAKFSGLLSAEVMAQPEIAEALEKLDMPLLNSKVVEIAMAKSGTVETASRITDTLNIGGKDLVSKYVTISE